MEYIIYFLPFQKNRNQGPGGWSQVGEEEDLGRKLGVDSVEIIFLVFLHSEAAPLLILDK